MRLSITHLKIKTACLFFILISLNCFGQYTITTCQTHTDALIGADRNDFVHNNGLTINEGYLHNFDPPTLPCGIVNPALTSLTIEIELLTIIAASQCANIPIFGNVLLNCPLTTTSICPIVQDVLSPGCSFGVGETMPGTYSLNIMTCGVTPVSTDVIGVDIIPATDFSGSCPSNGMAITNGTVSVTYEICIQYRYNQLPREPTITNVASNNPTDCGLSDGTITISAFGGFGGIEYSIDGGVTWQPGNMFTGLAGGNYDIIVRSVTHPTCTTMDNVTLTAPTVPTIDNVAPMNPSDCGVDDGTITITASGTGTLEYSIDGGTTWQTGNVFTGLAGGGYSIIVREQSSPGCSDTDNTTLTAPTIPTIDNVEMTDPTDCGLDDGTITITATGTATLEYSIDGGTTWQTGNLFTGLAGGSYSIIVRNQSSTACSDTDNTTLTAPVAPTISNVAMTDPTDCGVDDGTITITASGTGTLEYSIDGGATWQTGNLFTGLAGGSYSIIVREQSSIGCSETDNTTLTAPVPPTIDNVLPMNPTDCGVDDGTITITASGTGTLEYSIDGGTTWQTGNLFTGLAGGSYSIMVRDQTLTGCSDMDNTTLIAPMNPTIDLVIPNDPTDCGVNDGTITITATGVGTLEYSIDGGTTWQTSNVFSGLTGGNYPIVVREQASPGCNVLDNATLTSPISPTINDIMPTDPTDCGVNDGTITIDANGAGTLEYSIDGGATWQAGNMFSALGGGNYTIVIRELTSVGCTAMDMVTLSTPNTPVINNVISTDPSDCGINDGVIIIDAAGAGTLEYSIDGGVTWQAVASFSNLSGGIYSIVVREQSFPACETIDNVILATPAPPNITEIIETNPTNCGVDDGTISIIASGLGALSYSIDGGVTWQSNNLFLGLAGGIYSIVVREDLYPACVANDIVILATLVEPTIDDVVPVDPSDCGTTDGAILITASGVAALEYSIDGGISWQNTGTFGGLGAGNYSIIVRDQNNPGCQAIDNAVLSAPNVPSITNVAPVNPSDCGIDDGSITITAAGNGTLEYSIDGGTTWQTSNIYSGLGGGNYPIVVREQASPACQTTNNVVITSLSAPVISNIIDSNPSTCGVDDGMISIIASGTGTLEYSIDGGVTWQTNNDFLALAGGSYIVIVREQAVLGCDTMTTVMLLTPNVPTISNTTPINPTTCGVNDGSISVTASGIGTLEYSIDGGVTWQSSADFTGLGGGNYTVMVRELSSPACASTANVLLSTPNAPLINNINLANPSDCGIDDGSIIVNAAGIGVLEYSIDGGLSWQTDNNFTGLAGGNYDIVVREQSSPACQTLDNASLTIPDAPTITNVTSTNPTNCGVDDGTITITSSGSNLEYSIDGGTSWQAGNTFNNLGGGNYNIVVRDAAFIACLATDMALLVSPSLPVINMIGSTPPSDCGLDDGVIDIMASSADVLEYSIDGGMTWQQGNRFTGLAGGVYDVVVRSASSLTCMVTDNAVLASPSLPTMTIAPSSPSDCGVDDGSIVITAAGMGILEYSIDGGITWQSSGAFNGLAGGSYPITVRETASPNCLSMDNVVLANPVNPLIVGASVVDPSNCGVADGEININATGANPIEYSIDGGMTWQDDSLFSNLIEGNYSILARNKNMVGCFASDDVSLVCNATCVFNIIVNETLCPGDIRSINNVIYDEQNPIGTDTVQGINCDTIYNISLSYQSNFFIEIIPSVLDLSIGDTASILINTNIDANWSWSPQPNILCDTCMSTLLTVTESQVYVLEIIDQNGCIQSDQLVVNISNTEVYVPNAFSPNDDNINDRFTFYSNQDTEIELFNIYNRWGDLLYSRDGIMLSQLDGWDGHFKGKLMDAATFTYVLKIRGENKNIYSGTIQLIR